MAIHANVNQGASLLTLQMRWITAAVGVTSLDGWKGRAAAMVVSALKEPLKKWGAKAEIPWQVGITRTANLS